MSCNGPWEYDTIEAAANGGHLAALTYAVENGCPAFDESGYHLVRIEGALEKGYLEVVRYLYEETECDLVGVCHDAAQGGHLEVLKYTVANFGWTDPEDCREVAEENGHTAMVEWIDSVREV